MQGLPFQELLGQRRNPHVYGTFAFAVVSGMISHHEARSTGLRVERRHIWPRP